MIITISGGYGSGVKRVGELVADALGYQLYDDEIVTQAFKAGSTYMDESTLRCYDESEGWESVDDIAQLSRVQQGISKVMQSLSLDVLPLDLRLDAAIHGALNRLADGDNCILLGRCANYYLRGRKNLITLFLTDSEKNKISRVEEYLECDADTASRFIRRADKKRSQFYSYFTGEKWDDAENYDIRIDCGLLGEKGTAEIIQALVALKEK